MKTLVALFIGMLFASSAAVAQQSLQDLNYDDNGRFASGRCQGISGRICRDV